MVADAILVLALDHRGGLSTDLREVVDAAFDTRRAEVHQATGLIAAQQGISVSYALACLRAHAFATGRPLHLVSADLMARRLRLDTPAGSSDRGVREVFIELTDTLRRLRHHRLSGPAGHSLC